MNLIIFFSLDVPIEDFETPREFPKPNSEILDTGA